MKIIKNLEELPIEIIQEFIDLTNSHKDNFKKFCKTNVVDSYDESESEFELLLKQVLFFKNNNIKII